MNMSVLALMISITFGALVLLVYAIAYDHPMLLVAMGAAALFAFAPGTAGSGVSDELPPWREITTDDYHPRAFPDGKGGAAWIASSQRIKDLLERQHAGELRLRLVLREAVDLKRGPRGDPTWLWGL